MYSLSYFAIACFISVISANDIRLGLARPTDRKIYSELKESGPALWTRTDDVVINTSGNEVISAIHVTDLRDDRDGVARIESGGIGQRTVVIGLESPTILRGYKFQIEVYAEDPNARYYNNYNTKGGRSYDYSDQQYSRKN